MIKFVAIERTHLKKLRDWRNELKDTFRQFRMFSMEDQERWFESLQHDPNRILYAVKDGKKLIGVCGWVGIDWVNRHADLSIYVGTEFINQGYGTQMLHELHRIAFMELNLETVRLEVFDFNPAKNLYLRVGYKEVGRYRSAHFYQGKYWDSILMDMTREDYLNQVANPA